MTQHKFTKFVKFALIVALLATFLGMAALSLYAQDSGNIKIFFSGVLKNSQQEPAESGQYNMRFFVYPTATSTDSLWTEEFSGDNKIQVEKGRFQVILGARTPFQFNLEEGNYWLGVMVGGKGSEIEWGEELKPRIPITSLENLLLGGSVSISEKDFIKNLVDEFEKNATSTDNLTQQAFLQFIQRKLSASQGTAVVISPSTLNLLFDKILNFQQQEQPAKEQGVWQTLLGFFKKILETISHSLAQIFSRVDELLTKTSKIEKDVGEVLSILQKQQATTTQGTASGGMATDGASSGALGKLPLNVNSLVEDSGQAMISKGETTVKVYSKYVTPNARIFISPRSPISGIWWISQRKNNQYFEVSIISPPEENLLLDYWILTPKDEMLTVFPLPEAEDVASSTNATSTKTLESHQENTSDGQKMVPQESTQNIPQKPSSSEPTKPENEGANPGTDNTQNATSSASNSSATTSTPALPPNNSNSNLTNPQDEALEQKPINKIEPANGTTTLQPSEFLNQELVKDASEENNNSSPSATSTESGSGN